MPARPRGSAVSLLLIAAVWATPQAGHAFDYAARSDVVVAPDDFVLDATVDANGGVWTPDSRSPDAADFLRRRPSSGDGAFTLFGDRVRATVRRASSIDSALGISAPSGSSEGTQSYWIEADLFRHGDIDLSAYGAYRQVAAPMYSPVDNLGRDTTTAGLSMGLSGWRSWLERRESPDDIAISHFANATRMLTYSTGIALGPAVPSPSSFERLKIDVSRSTPTAQWGDTAETPVEYSGNESRHALGLTLGHRWQAGTTRLQMARAITGAPNAADETESRVRLAHQVSSGPWRGEAAVGLVSTRDDRPIDAFQFYAYELSAKIDYFAAGIPDLTARVSHTETNRELVHNFQSDVDSTWQVSGTIGFGKFLTGGVRRAGRFVDLNFSVKRDDAAAAWLGDPLDASVGIATGLRF